MQLGRLFIILGLILVVVGVILTYSGSLSFLKLGRLPGDISFKRESFSFYFPITTCILISVILTVIFYFFKK